MHNKSTMKKKKYMAPVINVRPLLNNDGLMLGSNVTGSDAKPPQPVQQAKSQFDDTGTGDYSAPTLHWDD